MFFDIITNNLNEGLIMKLLSNKDLERMNVSERKEYYRKLKSECALLANDQNSIGQDIIKRVYPFLRKYKIEIENEENLPEDSNIIFLFNHSNSHDIFTAYEILSKLNRRGSVMVATDCLSPLTKRIFDISNATLFDRRLKNDRQNSVLNLSNKIINGNDGIIFGESTWNLHPILPMHNIRQGVSKISLITQTPVMPGIIEYVEDDCLVNKESDLYKKCVVRFGNLIDINYEGNLEDQTNFLKEEMIRIRRKIWNDYNINRTEVENVDPQLYINHTYMKKYKAFGFTYDSLSEQNYLLFLGDEARENEYTIDDNGLFIPGITERKKIKKLLKR